MKPLFVDFTSKKILYRIQSLRQGKARQEPLIRAIGWKGQRSVSISTSTSNNTSTSTSNPTLIFDITSGFGQDSFILACLGYKVHMIERSPLIGALVQDGLERAKQDPRTADIVSNIQYTLADAKEVLLNLRPDQSVQSEQTEQPDQTPSIIYLDPMFPERKKSAQNKLKMRILKDIVGDDLDAQDLLTLSLTRATHRVVVKRPSKAATLTSLKPDFTVLGKSNRFDIYLTGHSQKTERMEESKTKDE